MTAERHARRSGRRRRRPSRRRLVLDLVALLAIAAALALWQALRFDAPRQFWEQKGELLSARADSLAGDSLYLAYDVELTSSEGYAVRGHLRVPRRPGRYPSIIVIGGIDTGRMAAEHITPDEPYVVLGLDYPWEGPRRLTPWQFLVRVLAIRKAMLLTPSAVFLAIDYIQAHPRVNQSAPVLVGASFGAQLMTVAGALDERAGPVLAVYGGGDFALLLRGSLRFRPLWLRAAVAQIGAWLLEPVEPTRYAARIAPRPFVMINGKQDQRILTASVDALYHSAREPKRLIWLNEGHISPWKPQLLERVVDAAAQALVEMNADESARETAWTATRNNPNSALP